MRMLRSDAVSPSAAIGQPAARGVPEALGIYAWRLVDRHSLPGVEPAANGLLYIGIAPNSERSKATLRSRIVRNHLRRPVATSTLRLALAAHLWEHEGWTPFMTPGGKVALSRQQEQALTGWMERKLLVSWTEHDRPKDVEEDRITKHRPPLNSDHNKDHDYYPTLREKRGAFIAAANAAGVRVGSEPD